MPSDRSDLGTEYEIGLVFSLKARFLGVRSDLPKSIGYKLERLQSVIERVVAEEFHDQPTLVSAEFRLAKDGHSPAKGRKHRVSPAKSKKGTILQLLASEDGVTSSRLQEATGWKPNTVSAQLDYLSKTGHEIHRQKKDGVLRYRLIPAARRT